MPRDLEAKRAYMREYNKLPHRLEYDRIRNRSSHRRAYHKEIDHKRSGRTIRFGEKKVRLTFNPRKGICSSCGKTELTHMHHDEYFIIFKWFGTRELCVGCHNKMRDYSSPKS